MDGRLAVSRQEEEDQVTILEPGRPPAPLKRKITGIGIALRGFLDLQSQAVHAAMLALELLSVRAPNGQTPSSGGTSKRS